MRRGKFSPSYSISIEDRLSLRPESTFEGRWRRNPYPKESPHTLKTRIELGIFFLLILSIFFLCFFHPFFQIRNVSFSGLSRIQESKIQEFTQTILQGNTLFFLPKKNYFLLNKKKLESSLQNEFSFEKLSIEKKFPHILIIRVEEKIPALVYDNQKNYLLLGKQGEKLEVLAPILDNEWEIFSQIVTSTTETGETIQKTEEIGRKHHPNQSMGKIGEKNYPLVHDTRKNISEQDVSLPETTVDSILKWYDFLENRAHVSVKVFEILEGGTEAFIWTKENWGIYIKFMNTIEAFPIFLSLLPQINQNNLEYIDMRYLTRVYWK